MHIISSLVLEASMAFPGDKLQFLSAPKIAAVALTIVVLHKYYISLSAVCLFLFCKNWETRVFFTLKYRLCPLLLCYKWKSSLLSTFPGSKTPNIVPRKTKKKMLLLVPYPRRVDVNKGTVTMHSYS